MPNNGDVSGYTGVFRLASPSDPHRKVIKRNRQVVSCVPCRNRKLKCDRQQPCSSCVRRHDEGSCRFFGGGGGGGAGAGGGGAGASSLSSPGRPGATGHGCRLRRREVQARLQALESMFGGLVGDAAAATAGQDEGSAQSMSRQGDDVGLVGATNTNYAAVLECIRDLQGYVDATADDDPPPPPPLGEGSSSPRHRHRQKADDQPLGPAAPVTTSEIMDRLPPRAECDAMLMFYFQQIFLIPVVVHSGQFQRAYERFWEDPGGTSLLWTSTLFTLLSMSTFLQATHALGRGDDGPGTMAPETKERIAGFSAMAHRCLLAGDHLQGKPLCVEATLLFGMHLVLQKRDADPLCWHSIGTAVRLAQRMGYHRDASSLGRGGRSPAASPFEAEMRRRTWYTLEYLDLVYSFQIGVPPIIQGDDVDTQLPANLRDDEFDEDTRTLPQARPTLDCTPILGFIFYSRQLRLLRRVARQALAVTRPPPAEVRRLDADLRALHEDVPPSLRYKPVRESGFADVPDVIMRRVACEMLHLKCLVVLHRGRLSPERDDGSHDGSREACVEASLRLLDLQAELDEQSGRGGRLYEKRYALADTGYHDFLVAAMCVCLDLVAGPQASNDQRDHERKVESLRRARTIWRKTAGRSREAAHATNVLEQMLGKISSRADPSPTRTRTSSPRANVDGGEGPSGRDAQRRDTPARPATWSAVNSPAPPRGATPKSIYGEWMSAVWLVDQPGQPRDQARDDGHGSIMWAGGVDWNLIDSFLLDREHAANTAASQDSGGTNPRASRDGWPYLRFPEPPPPPPPQPQAQGQGDHVEEGPPRGSRFRTWSRAGMSLGGFSPSSVSTFL